MLGKPDIFNTDQGSQFTSFAFTNTLKDADIRISMDGRGRWMDNVFIERLWRSAPLSLRRQDTRRGLCYAGPIFIRSGIAWSDAFKAIDAAIPAGNHQFSPVWIVAPVASRTRT